MQLERPLSLLSDDEFLRRLVALLTQSRRVESDLVAHIGEVDARRLFAREASPSMFVYCTEVLHLSEAEAYLRIAAARAAREHPELLAMLADGRLHLSGLVKLAPHLTRENREAVLSRATYRSKRQIEELVAELAPRPDVPAVMRRLPGKPLAVGAERFNSVRAESKLRPRPTYIRARSMPSQPLSDRVASAELRPDGVASAATSTWPTPIQPLSPSSATKSSSPPAPGSTTSWSGLGT